MILVVILFCLFLLVCNAAAAELFESAPLHRGYRFGMRIGRSWVRIPTGICEIIQHWSAPTLSWEYNGWMDGWMVYCIINGLTITILWVNDDEHD